MTDFVYPLKDLQTFLAMGYRNNIMGWCGDVSRPDAKLGPSIERLLPTLKTNFPKEPFYKNMQLEKLLDAEVDTKSTERVDAENYQIKINDGHANWHPRMGYYECKGVNLTDYFSSNKTISRYQDYVKQENRLGDLAYLNCISPIGLFIKSNKELAVTYAGEDKRSLDCNVVFVDISKNTDVTLREEFFSNDNIMLTKIYYIIREGASLELKRRMYDCGHNVIESKVIQHPHSQFTADIFASDSQYTQNIFDIDSYSDCESRIYSKNDIGKTTSNHVSVNINHYGKDSKSLIDVKTVLQDKSYSSFSGNINIVKKAENVSAHMVNKNLLLSPTATAVTEPNLDISTKEVECSHGCTISNIDKDVLYYLNSRGYDDTDAKEIIIESFLT